MVALNTRRNSRVLATATAVPIGDLNGLEESHRKELQTFSRPLEDCLQRASIFNSNNLDEQKYKEALCSLESVLLAKDDGTSHDLLIPGPLAPEVAFAQPYLLAVLQALGSIVDKVVVRGSSSPGKTMVQTNRIVVPSSTQSTRPKRIADKSIAANSRFIFMLRDDSVEIPVEEKPGERKGIKPGNLLCE